MTTNQDPSRAEFEAWYAKRHPNPVHENSTWAHASKMDDWEVWQAARRAPSTPAITQMVICDNCESPVVVPAGSAQAGKEPEWDYEKQGGKLIGYDECKCVLSQYCDGKCKPIFEYKLPDKAAADGAGELPESVINALWYMAYYVALQEAGTCIGNADVAHMNRHLVFARLLKDPLAIGEAERQASELERKNKEGLQAIRASKEMP